MRIRTGLAATALAVAGLLATTAGVAAADDLDIQFSKNLDVPLPQGACGPANLIAIPINQIPGANATCNSDE